MQCIARMAIKRILHVTLHALQTWCQHVLKFENLKMEATRSDLHVLFFP